MQNFFTSIQVLKSLEMRGDIGNFFNRCCSSCVDDVLITKPLFVALDLGSADARSKHLMFQLFRLDLSLRHYMCCSYIRTYSTLDCPLKHVFKGRVFVSQTVKYPRCVLRGL